MDQILGFTVFGAEASEFMAARTSRRRGWSGSSVRWLLIRYPFTRTRAWHRSGRRRSHHGSMTDLAG
jgi:hypothetical protein